MASPGEKEAPLKSAMMCKRAQGRSRMGTMNWKDRFFVLVPGELSYWDAYGGPDNKEAKKKGSIDLGSVFAVEEVPDSTFERPNMIQIVHIESILYIQCSDDTERQDWLRLLRREIKDNADKLRLYHKGYFDNKWTCCSQKKTSEGCAVAFDYSALNTRSVSDPLPPAPGTLSAQGSSSSLRSPSVVGTPLPPVPGSVQSTPVHLQQQQQQQQHIASPSVAPVLPPPAQPQEPATEGFEVVAMFAYNALEVHDLSVAQGERLTVLETPEEHWWRARNAQGKIGFIPSNYVRRLGIEAEPWFHGRISRSEAAAMLKVANQEGTFLVRESESKRGEYSLSVSHGDTLRHYHIRFQNGEYFVNDRHRFPDICKLIEYHKLNSGGLVTRLRKTLNDLNAPVTAGLGHDKWEIDPAAITLGRELGSGQFGVVREGVYKGNIKVAVKMMKKGAMSEDDFISEAQVMKNFRHPNLVQLYGVCTSVRPIYIVTELLSGCLLDYLRNNQWLSGQPDKIHFMSVQVCSAMSFLETHGFIHRDLAARNCLIGENFVVKVADFGLARYVLDDEYTASEGTKFPIKWAAPEVIQYARFSAKSDIWSYGILLWELWSIGCSPYPSFTNAEVVDKVLEGYRMSKPKLATSTHFTIMQDCWHKDPESRPTFGEICRRLEENKTDYEDPDD